MLTCQTINGYSFWIEGILTDDCYYGVIVVNGKPLVEAIASHNQLINPPSPHEFREACEKLADNHKINEIMEEKLLKEFNLDELAKEFGVDPDDI